MIEARVQNTRVQHTRMQHTRMQNTRVQHTRTASLECSPCCWSTPKCAPHGRELLTSHPDPSIYLSTKCVVHRSGAPMSAEHTPCAPSTSACVHMCQTRLFLEFEYLSSNEPTTKHPDSRSTSTPRALQAARSISQQQRALSTHKSERRWVRGAHTRPVATRDGMRSARRTAARSTPCSVQSPSRERTCANSRSAHELNAPQAKAATD
jgi:hypothetical protein